MTGIDITHDALRSTFVGYTEIELALLAIAVNALNELSVTRPETTGPLAYLIGHLKLSGRQR